MNEPPRFNAHEETIRGELATEAIPSLFAVLGSFVDGTEAIAVIRMPGGAEKLLVGDEPSRLADVAQTLAKGSDHGLRLVRFDRAEILETFEAGE